MCLKIINRYPGFSENLKSWFFEFQKDHPEAHVSCAGRGQMDQEAACARGASRAHWGESAHNYSAALDVFVIIPGEKSIYPRDWFTNVLMPNIPNWLEWYGQPGAPFFELPHIEIRGWRQLISMGTLKLVSDGTMIA